PMGATTINRALEYMGYPLGDLSAHDFRATATTALYEMGYRRELVEMQLAHAKKDKTEAAYNHAEYLPERRKMLQAWADYLDELEAKAMQQRPAAVKSTDQSPTRPKPKRGRRASSAGEKSPR
ncbi:MAG TPA: tyrosine-type recombinase/integrase, partial [Solimonas sp.]